MLTKYSFVEIRVDLCGLETSEWGPLVRGASAGGKRVLVACRPGKMSEDERVGVLTGAMEWGADLVDVEVDGDPASVEAVLQRGRDLGCDVVLSFHDFHGTPGATALGDMADACLARGARFAKVACRVNAPSDGAALLGLLAGPGRQGRLVVVGMGPMGRVVRAAAPLLGSPFTYACASAREATAPGQMSFSATKSWLASMGRQG